MPKPEQIGIAARMGLTPQEKRALTIAQKKREKDDQTLESRRRFFGGRISLIPKTLDKVS